MSSSDIYCENSTREANIRQLEKMVDEIKSDTIDYNPDVHPRNPIECPVRTRMGKQKLDLIIPKLEWVHGRGRYDFSNIDVSLIKSDKQKVTCNQGHVFEMSINALVSGKGCQICTNSVKRDLDWFLAEAENIHGDTYDYSHVAVDGVHSKVKIICPIHGEFQQTPAKHIYAERGCTRCARRNLTKEDMFDDFYKTHGEGKYDYSMIKSYTGNLTKIPIICHIHGVFYMTPKDHKTGQNCPKCSFLNRTGGYSRRYWINHPDRKTRNGVVYLLRLKSPNSEYVKVGISIDIKSRILDIKRVSGFDVDVIRAIEMPIFLAWQFEKIIHARMKEVTARYDIEKFGGYTECYDVSYYNEINGVFDGIVGLIYNMKFHQPLYIPYLV